MCHGSFFWVKKSFPYMIFLYIVCYFFDKVHIYIYILYLCCVVRRLGDYREIFLFVGEFCCRLCHWVVSIGIGMCVVFIILIHL